MAVNLYDFIYSMQAIGNANHYAWNKSGPTPHSRKLVVEALSLYRRSSDLLDEIAKYGNFAILWPRVRCWLPLQFRLCAEQVMWDRGGEWRRYVSGFKAIDSPAATQSKDMEALDRMADRFANVDRGGPETSSTTTRSKELERRRAAASKRIGRKA